MKLTACSCTLAQDEKNQIINTNLWLNLVSCTLTFSNYNTGFRFLNQYF